MGSARRADERAPAGDVSPGAVVAAPTEERAVGEGAKHDDVTMAGPGGEKRPRESGGTPPRQRLLGRRARAPGTVWKWKMLASTAPRELPKSMARSERCGRRPATRLGCRL